MKVISAVIQIIAIDVKLFTNELVMKTTNKNENTIKTALEDFSFSQDTM